MEKKWREREGGRDVYLNDTKRVRRSNSIPSLTPLFFRWCMEGLSLFPPQSSLISIFSSPLCSPFPPFSCYGFKNRCLAAPLSYSGNIRVWKEGFIFFPQYAQGKIGAGKIKKADIKKSLSLDDRKEGSNSWGKRKRRSHNCVSCRAKKTGGGGERKKGGPP